MKERKKKMSIVIVGLLYVSCSALGLVLIKFGVNKGIGFSTNRSLLQIHFDLILLVGMLLYVLSFLLSMFVMSKMDLNYFYPVSAGIIYVLVCLLSFFILKETIQKSAILGMAFILTGVMIMNWPGGK